MARPLLSSGGRQASLVIDFGRARSVICKEYP